MRRTVKRDSIGHYVVALGEVFRPPARHDYSDRLSVQHKTGDRVTVPMESAQALVEQIMAFDKLLYPEVPT